MFPLFFNDSLASKRTPPLLELIFPSLFIFLLLLIDIPFLLFKLEVLLKIKSPLDDTEIEFEAWISALLDIPPPVLIKVILFPYILPNWVPVKILGAVLEEFEILGLLRELFLNLISFSPAIILTLSFPFTFPSILIFLAKIFKLPLLITSTPFFSILILPFFTFTDIVLFIGCSVTFPVVRVTPLVL